MREIELDATEPGDGAFHCHKSHHTKNAMRHDVPDRKLTVKHGRIENLDMSDMTRVFRVKDPALLAAVKPGWQGQDDGRSD